MTKPTNLGASPIYACFGMDELSIWMRNIQFADDRSCVIMGISYIDSLLGELLKAKMIAKSTVPDELLKERGPLGTLAARIDAAVAFGLISPELGLELHRLRRLRNKTAHNYIPVSLEEPPLSEMCESLRLGKNSPPVKAHKLKMRFVLAVASICMTLQTRVPQVQRCKRPKLDSLWPALVDEKTLKEAIEGAKKHGGRIPLDPGLYEF